MEGGVSQKMEIYQLQGLEHDYGNQYAVPLSCLQRWYYNPEISDSTIAPNHIQIPK